MNVRLDKWLWAARFFKTRALAKAAVDGGKVHLNGQRSKPSRELKLGDMLEVLRENDRYTVEVRELGERRVSAKLAVGFYQETAQSIESRLAIQRERKLIAQSELAPKKRPDKKSRRELMSLKKQS